MFGLDLTLVIIAVALAAVIGAYVAGRRHGAARERAQETSERLRAIDRARAVDRDIASMDAEERRRRLGRWSR